MSTPVPDCQRTPGCRYYATHDGPCEPRKPSAGDVTNFCAGCVDLAKRLAEAERDIARLETRFMGSTRLRP